MDGREFDLKPGEAIPLDDYVIRIVLVNNRDRSNKQIPAIREFSLHPADEGKLSVDYKNYTTPEQCLIRVGRSKNLKGEYKNPLDRELYILDVKSVLEIKNIDKVIYDPIIFEQEIEGKPNNPAHSLICINISRENEAEIYEKLRDIAVLNGKLEVKISVVNSILKET